MSLMSDTTISAEHHTLYEYSLVNAQNHWLGVIQTETVSPIQCLARFYILTIP